MRALSAGPPCRRGTLAAATGGAAVVLAASSALVQSGDARGLDRAGFAVLGGTRAGALAQAAGGLALAAEGAFALAVLAAVGVLARRRAWSEGTVLGAGLLACVAGARIAKLVARRPRPAGGLLSAHGYSFPSTDAALAVAALALALALARPASRRARRWLTAGAGASAVAGGLLLVALRVHYLSDVLAGWALGVLAFSGCALAADLAARRCHGAVDAPR